MLTFTLAMSCLTTSNLPWFIDLTFFTASEFACITSHVHNWVLFLLWLRLFILFGVISPLISSSILGTYRPGEFIFQYPIFLSLYCSWGSQGKNREGQQAESKTAGSKTLAETKGKQWFETQSSSGQTWLLSFFQRCLPSRAPGKARMKCLASHKFCFSPMCTLYHLRDDEHCPWT